MLVDLPCRHVVVEGHILIQEALVVAQVKVDFATIFEDVHFPMFVGIHRPCVDVQIRIDLDGSHVEPGIFQESTGACGRNPLPESGHDPASDEHELVPERWVVVAVGVVRHTHPARASTKTVSERSHERESVPG